jgi:hypothetical protein
VKKLLLRLFVGAVVVSAGTATAADLIKAPPPLFGWSGCYAGGAAGLGTGHVSWRDVSTPGDIDAKGAFNIAESDMSGSSLAPRSVATTSMLLGVRHQRNDRQIGYRCHQPRPVQAFFRPDRRFRTPARAEAVKVGRRSAIEAYSLPFFLSCFLDRFLCSTWNPVSSPRPTRVGGRRAQGLSRSAVALAWRHAQSFPGRP